MLCEETGMDEFWIDDLDLSTLTPGQFSIFFFDRPIVAGVDAKYHMFLGGFEAFDVSNPARVVENVQAMCRDFAELAKIYSPEQLDQGLWSIFGAVLHCAMYLFEPAVEIGLRIDCVESMYIPFRDVVARRTTNVKESFYWMWWDMVLLRDSFPMPKEYKHGYLTLTADQSQMIEIIFQTLSKILALDHRGCQICALHGLGHLYHPSLERLVQRYLDEHRSEFSDEDVRWIEDCRDSSVQ
jgi:hypothetical protein